MRFFLHILLITGMAVGLSSCGAISNFFPGGGNDDASLPEDGTVPVDGSVATDGTAVDAEDPTNAGDGTTPDGEGEGLADGSVPAEDFDAPIVEETSPVGSVPLDLIASTDPEERIRLVQRDRPDPFDILRTTPTLEIPADALTPPAPPIDRGSGSNGNGPSGPGSNGSNGSGANGSGPGSNGSGPNSSTPGTGSLAPIPDLVPIAPPPPPQPETARAVTVTGVVQIGSVPYAIVNAPNEPHSRYVRSGQFLSNGQVLVKRIEMVSGGIDPVVILEEFGVEVARQVGDQGARPEAADAPPPTPEADVVYGDSDTVIGVVTEAS